MRSKKVNTETEKLEKEFLRKAIKALIAFHEIPAKEISKKVNISPAYFSMILNGKRINEETLQKIITELFFIIQTSNYSNYTKKILSKQENEKKKKK